MFNNIQLKFSSDEHILNRGVVFVSQGCYQRKPVGNHRCRLPEILSSSTCKPGINNQLRMHTPIVKSVIDVTGNKKRSPYSHTHTQQRGRKHNQQTSMQTHTQKRSPLSLKLLVQRKEQRGLLKCHETSWHAPLPLHSNATWENRSDYTHSNNSAVI